MAASVREESFFQEKYPLKRLEFRLNNIIKVTTYHLDMFKNQKTNIAKYKSLQLWKELEDEQVNASRTVQQLKADIEQIELIAHQNVLEQDLPLFRARIDPICIRIHCDVCSFLETHEESKWMRTNESQQILSPSSSHLFGVTDDPEENMSGANAIQEQQLLEEGVERAQVLLESWEALKQELEDLNKTMCYLADIVANQGEKLDRIDNVVAEANENVEEGKKSLKKAAVLKAAILPVTGAVVGCVLAGPVGFIVGLKAAGASAVVGSILGYAGGRYYQKRKCCSLEEVEMLQMSTSSPPS